MGSSSYLRGSNDKSTYNSGQSGTSSVLGSAMNKDNKQIPISGVNPKSKSILDNCYSKSSYLTNVDNSCTYDMDNDPDRPGDAVNSTLIIEEIDMNGKK